MSLPDYSPDALRGLLTSHKLTGSQAGRLLGVDGRTIRKWTAGDTVSTHRDMPQSAWWLLLLLTGEATIPQITGAAGLDSVE